MAYSSTQSSPRAMQFAMMSMAGADGYDGLSEISSPGSEMSYDQPFTGYEPVLVPMFPYTSRPTGYIMRPPEAAPIELVTDYSMGENDRRRRRTSTAASKEGLSQSHSRRRAQNRASQRAFRDRKEKHVKDLEGKLRELEDKNQTLEDAYADLLAQHDKLKRDMNSALSKADPSDTDAPATLCNEEDADGSFEKILADDMIYSDSYYVADGQLDQIKGEPS